MDKVVKFEDDKLSFHKKRRRDVLIEIAAILIMLVVVSAFIAFWVFIISSIIKDQKAYKLAYEANLESLGIFIQDKEIVKIIDDNIVQLPGHDESITIVVLDNGVEKEETFTGLHFCRRESTDNNYHIGLRDDYVYLYKPSGFSTEEYEYLSK